MYTPIKLNTDIISQLPVYDDLPITRELMGADEIKADIELPGVLMCPIGAYIMHGGNKYTVNTVPSVTKGSKYAYKYTVTFESDLYRLYDKGFKHLGNKTFQYYGTPSDYAQLIVDNINDIDSGWSVGACDDAPALVINFDGHTCRTALDTIAEAFVFEWSVVGKVVSIVKQVGNTTSLVFKYGRGNGLYSLGYQYQDDKNIVTRAFGYGSTRNLPQGYRDGATQLMFDGLYLEENVSLYRVKEGNFSDETIYPKVEGTATAVSVYDPDAANFTITDSGLAFDIWANRSSQTPKISFLTGELQGQEFEIVDYDNTTKTIKIKVFVDGNNNTLPRVGVVAAIGDTYTLFDMFMPPEAVADAEDRLQAATQAWLDENCIPRVVYNLELDPLYARDNGIILNPGDKVTVQDTDLGIDTLIRVTSVSYPFNFPDVITPSTKITAQIANFIPYTQTERVIAATIDNQKGIKIVDRTNAERARIGALNLKTLQGRIFNPDGTLFTGPDSLVAGMAAFGYDSQNFNLNNVTVSPNDGANPNSLSISGGDLIHRIYQVTGLGYDWVLTAHNFSGLNPAKFYYVYAKCSKVALTGTWEISEIPVHVNDISGYFAFNLGILYEVNSDGYRDFEFTKGMTYIVGDTITTGRIKDLTGVNYFDLTSAKFNLGDATNGIDFDVTTAGTLTIRGALATKLIEVGSGGVSNAGISGLTDAGSSSIRFWAGDTAANKAIAPFRVTDDGQVTMQSGLTGQRIVISSADNSFKFYNSSDEVIIDIDDDIVPEGVTWEGPIPHPVYTTGPGLLVGEIAGDFSSIGRAGIVTSGFMNSNSATTFDLVINNSIKTYDSVSGGAVQTGITGEYEYDLGSVIYKFTFVNGILVNQEVVP